MLACLTAFSHMINAAQSSRLERSWVCSMTPNEPATRMAAQSRAHERSGHSLRSDTGGALSEGSRWASQLIRPPLG
jgi:hypothetical protein